MAWKRLKELLTHRVKPIFATTPEELAGELGLSAVAAKEWQVQHLLLKRLKEIVRRQKINACGDCQAGGHFA